MTTGSSSATWIDRPSSSEAKVSDILSAAGAAGLEIVDLTTEEADLEDIFLQLTRDPPVAPAGDRRAAEL